MKVFQIMPDYRYRYTITCLFFFCLALLVTPVFLCGQEKTECSLLTKEGKRVTCTFSDGKTYTLLFLVKPWSGRTKSLLTSLKSYEKDFYGRVKPLIVFPNTRRAVANSYMEKINLKKTQFLIDDAFSVCKLFKPSCLPSVILISKDGSEIYRTSSINEEFLKNLSSQAPWFIATLHNQNKSVIKTTAADSDVHGPWGPPTEKLSGLKDPDK